MGVGGDMVLDVVEDIIYFCIGWEEVVCYLVEGIEIELNFGLRNMGVGFMGIVSMNLNIGEIDLVVVLLF